MEEKISEIVKRSKEHAKEKGINLNPDEKVVEAVVKGLIAHQEKNGELYCPCRVLTGDKEEDKKIICPCVYHLDEIEKDGHCHCMLFVK